MKIAAILISWLALTAAAFWQFHGRYLLPVSKANGAVKPVPRLDTLEGIDLGSYRGQIVWLNFWNPDCGCSEFAQSHVAKLAQSMAGKPVKIITIIVPTTSSPESALNQAHSQKLPGQYAMDPKGKLCQEFDVLAAPAAVIYDAKGNPVYRGAYNVARFCDNDSTAYAAKTLEALVAQNPIPKFNLPFYGCQTIAAK